MHLWVIASLLLVSLTLGTPAYATNTHTLPQGVQEFQAFNADALGTGYIVRGCLHATAAGFSATISSCAAYLRPTTPSPYLVYTEDASARTVTYNAGNGDYWLIVHRDTTSTVAGWTRVVGAHYLWQKTATRPTLPAEALWLLHAVVSGGALTLVEDLRIPRSFVQYGVYDVTDSLYGAIPNDGLDDSPAFLAAINGLPLDGGEVAIPRGTFHLAQTVTLGNGGVGLASTRNNIRLTGAGGGNYDAAKAATVLAWTGGALPIIWVKGPLIGWGVNNLLLQGNGLANSGIYVVSGQYGSSQGVGIIGINGNSIQTNCVPTFPAWNGVTDALKIVWSNFWIWQLPPAPVGSAAVALGSSSITCNTDFNEFYNLTAVISGVQGYGVWLGAADHITFYALHIIDNPDAISGVHFAWDNGIHNGWPCGVAFFNLSLGNSGMTSSGTPHPDSCLNFVYGSSGGDPTDFIPVLPKLVAYTARRLNQNAVIVPGAAPGTGQPVGDLELHSIASRPSNFIPTEDNVADLGRTSQRWKDVYVRGAVIQPGRSVIGDDVLYTLTDHYLQLLCTTTCQLLLSDATFAGSREYTIKRANLTQVNVVASPPQLIDGIGSYVMPAGNAAITGIRIRSDGANWWIVGKF